MLSITDFRFPVFRIRNHIKIVEEDRITTVESRFGVWVLDNKNLEGANMGERRLRMRSMPYPLKNPINTVEELIKSDLACKFVDYDGKVFRYKKSKFYKIITKPCIIEKVKGFKYKIKMGSKTIMYYSLHDITEYKYCVVILADGGYLVYTFSEQMLPDTRRKL